MHLDTCHVKTVVDAKQDRLNAARKMYPSLVTSQNVTDALSDPEIDAVVIATPVLTHYELAHAALLNGKHVLLEKPMTSSTAEAEKLMNSAREKSKVLMVDHTFLYTGAVRKIKDAIAGGEIGRLQYFDSTRINLGLFQPDINVVWDLAPHDLSILFHLTDERPESISANGISHTNNGVENLAYLTLNFEKDIIAHFTCSWTSPVKVRQTLIGGSQKMIVYDDIEPTEKVKIYDTSYGVTKVMSEEERYSILMDFRVGDINAPKIDQTEALRGVAIDFISAIVDGQTPVSDYQSGYDVVKVLEAAQQSIKQRGKEVMLT